MGEGEIIIQKYGGSSVANASKMKKVAEHIIETAKSNEVVVVVSAMGDETIRLEKLAYRISKGQPSLSELDKLLVTGEEKSAALLAMAIGEESVSRTAFQIRLEVVSAYGRAKIKGIRNIDAIKDLLNQGKIVVVAGFQGVVEGSDEIVTLGRGGSDLTAVALAAALDTHYCEIYTDVDGIYTVDPRIVPRAKRYESIDYSTMLQLSGAGAGVLMDRCVILAQNLGVEIRVLLSPSFGKSSGGTLVYSGSVPQDMEGLTWAQAGLAVQEEVALISIYDVPAQPEMKAKIYRVLADINLIDSNIVKDKARGTFSIPLLCFSEDLPRLLDKLKTIRNVKIASDFEMVGLTLVDPAMKGQSGCLARISESLSKAKVDIEMSSSSSTSILVVVKKQNLQKAAQALGEEFFLLTSA